jgi:LysR family transcriptional regulator, positive regulator for ilvC
MDIKALQVFVALAENLHFGETAKRCHMGPSTVSRVIQRLEDEVGEPLFVRDNRAVALTKAGSHYRLFAQTTLEQWQQMQREMQSSASSLQGELNLYCSVTASYSLLNDLLPRFREQYPAVEITLRTGDAADAFQVLSSGQADLAIAARPDVLPAKMAFKPITTTPLRFIAPTLPCAVSRLLSQSDWGWQHIPFIVPEQGIVRDRLDKWFRDKNLKPLIYAQVAGHEAIVAMVALGFGAGVVPGIVLENSPMAERVRVLSASPEMEAFSVGLCALNKKLDNPVLQAFWQISDSLSLAPSA